MTNYIARGRSIVMPLTNNSGGSVGAGDVVIVDTAAAGFTTTTTEKQTVDIVGVMMEGVNDTEEGRVCVGGFVEVVNLNNSAGYGDFLYTDDVAKFGIASATLESGAFGQALDSGATPPAVLYIKPERFIDADPVWEAEGDILVGTGPNAAAIVSIGSAGEVLTVSGGTATWQPVDAGSVDLDLGFTAQGDILVGTGGDNWTALGIGAEGEVLTVSGGDAAWLPGSSASGFWISAPFLAAYTPTTGANTIFTSPNNENTLIMLSGGYPNVHDGIYLQDGEETQTGTMLVAPYTGILTLYLVFHVDMGPAAAGNLYYSYDVSVHSANDTDYADGYPGTFTTMAVTNSLDKIIYQQISAGTYSVTAGDSISVRFIADRNSILDTAGDTISIWQVAGVYS